MLGWHLSRPLTIRAQLTWRWTVTFALLLGLTNLVVYLGFRAYASNDLDAQVRTLAATELASSTDAEDVHIHEFPSEQLHGAAFAEKIAQLFDATGQVVRASAPEAKEPLLTPALLESALAGQAPVTTTSLGSRTYRVGGVAGEKNGRRYVIAVGVSTESFDASLALLASLLGTVWVAGVALTAWLGYGLASRALAPIDRITRQAAEIAAGRHALRLDVASSVDDELGRMTDLLNTMLERLHRTMDAHKRFAADASHELRSPLTAMLGEIDVALRRERSASDYKETLGIVRARLREMVELSEDLMLLTRAQEGRADAAAPEVGLRTLLEGSVARFRAMAADRGVTVLLEPDDPEVLVYGEERLLARIFDNLLSNAIFYNHAGGTVVVRTRLERGPATDVWVPPSVVVSVEDTGVGIPPAAWEQVFDRFLRLDVSRSRRTGGAGLGLSIARAVAELYGGRVAILRSSAEGTTFEVRLPGRTRLSMADLERMNQIDSSAAT